MIHHRRGTRRPTKRASRYEKNRIDNTTSTTWSQENQEQKVRDFERCHCFVIKSFSETNLHKSLKYGIWTSTFVHNRFLDQIYRDELISSSPCPILFFFSVCKSRHFNGIARMSSPLVKDRKFLLWDKQKYGSFFSVEWLVVKDVPNYILKNIKWNHFAVTNSLVSSRDCEKIPSKEAFEAISVFCDYQSTTSAWDDFQYFDREQKELEEKRGIDAETDSPFTQVESE